jgi:hypothetical protein
MKHVLDKLDEIESSLHDLNVIFVKYIQKYKNGIDFSNDNIIKQLVKQSYEYNIKNKKIKIDNIEDIIDKIVQMIKVEMKSHKQFMKIRCVYETDPKYKPLLNIFNKLSPQIPLKAKFIIIEYIIEYINKINTEVQFINSDFLHEISIDAKYHNQIKNIIDKCIISKSLTKLIPHKKINNTIIKKQVSSAIIPVGQTTPRGILIYGSISQKKTYDSYKNFNVSVYNRKTLNTIMKKLSTGVNIQLFDKTNNDYMNDMTIYKNTYGNLPTQKELTMFLLGDKTKIKGPAIKYFIYIYKN